MLPEPLARLPELEGDLPHLEEALTHASFANEQRSAKRIDNQRLEFLGDAVLGLCVTELLMERFPDAREGELSLMRAALVNTEALAAWARSVELGAALRLGRGAGVAGERDQTNVLADAAEALVAAVYLDRGIERARALTGRIVEGALARLEGGTRLGRDPKSLLQERLQVRGGPSPRYRVVAVEGPDHERVFTAVAEADGGILGEGRGRSKKLAEQAAARAALEAIEVIAADPVSSEDEAPRADAPDPADAGSSGA
jgi:ribonuclease-3